MAPVVHGLEAQYFGRIGFVYLDIDDPANEPFKNQFGFRAQPQFFLIDGGGNVIGQWLGFVDASEFQTAFDAALN